MLRRSGRIGVVVACLAMTVLACGDSEGGQQISLLPTSTSVATTADQAESPSPSGSNEPEAVADSPGETSGDENVAASDAAGTGVPDAFDGGDLPFDFPAATFPLRLSDDGSHLVDAGGAPFLIQGDAAWSFVVQLDVEDAIEYLDTRRSQGFNSLVVNLIENHFSDDPPRNVFGDEPFLDPGDFSTPNPAYFDHAAALIELAAERGFLVLLTPAYLGYGGGEEGWYQDMQRNGPDVLREYGRFVGTRFADKPNILWVEGGDFTPPDEDLDLVESVTAGIKDVDTTHLHTAHWSPETSSADVAVDFLDLNATYTYEPVQLKGLADDGATDLPHFLFESAYENDIKDTTPESLRGQAYAALLTGGIGHVYGEGRIWQFLGDWRDGLETGGVRGMSVVRALFEQLPWWTLRPDTDGTFLVDGQGEFQSREYALAAVSDAGAFAVVYVPTQRRVELDVAAIGGDVRGWWVDPVDGGVGEAELRDEGETHVSIESPGSNSADEQDWVLILQRTDG